jgi:SAM-dependent methyltransferase
MDWYKNWFGSPYYKILYQNRDDVEAQEFVENLLRYLQPTSGSNMLDIACGEGRFARQLAEHGYDVSGIDISHESIEKAKAFETDNLHFFIQDMRFPFYINYFDYAFNFFTSFGYFSHDRDHALAAKSFSAALKKDGILVVDYFNYEFVINNMVADLEVQRGSYNFHIKKSIERNHILKQIDFIDADNRPRTYLESVAAFSLADFIRMFKNADLSLVATFGDYALGPFHPSESPRLIMIFKKKYA